jgi:adenine-specific DNA-methyltransferase
MIIHPSWRKNNNLTLYRGDCAELLAKIPDASIDLTLTSPPYCIGKAYEDKRKAEDFLKDHEAILPEIVRVTKLGGSICWQVGYHVDAGVVTPLDFVVFQILNKFPHVRLRNRIIWTFGHGLHDPNRFCGRHESLLWFTKGDEYTFNLDAVRVAQKYPGKKGYKGSKKGEYSGNPLGKNPSDVWQEPSDVWDLPNVKSRHPEKTGHPCQFPLGLARRTIKALTDEGDLVLDPYTGAGTTAAGAVLTKRRFVGAELEPKYYKIAVERIKSAAAGTLHYRSENKPVYSPPANTPLTTVPPGWRQHPSHEEVSLSPS